MTNGLAHDSGNSAFYDVESATYDERWESKGGALTNRVQQRIQQAMCADWNRKRIVEVGPGTARFTIPLTKRGNQMTLVDISPGMLNVARKNIEAAGTSEQIENFLNGSIYELPLEDNSYDHAIALNVFNHLERPGDALKELSRVIKPGSMLLFNYANLQSYYWPAARAINSQGAAVGKRVYSSWERPGAVKGMIHDAGLALVRKMGHVHVPRAVGKTQIRHVAKLLDVVSRNGPLKRLAPVHFCLCRKTSLK